MAPLTTIRIGRTDRRAARWAALSLALAFCLPHAEARAQAYPTKPVRIISPFGAGSPPDTSMRVIAERLTGSLGQNVIVENRPGAGTTIGARAAASAEPDGYTLLQVNASLAYAPALYKDPGYDPLKSFAPVASLASWSLALVVSPDLPVGSVQELIAYARAHPGKVNIAFPHGSPPQILAESFKTLTGAPLNSVPYHQLAQLTADLAAGRVQAIFTIAPAMLSMVQQGKLKALVYVGTTRHPALLNVPTAAEAGLPKLTLDPSDWVGIVAPAGIPQPVVTRLNAAIDGALQTSEVHGMFAKFGWNPRSMSSAEFATFLASEMKKWPEVVKAAGLGPT